MATDSELRRRGLSSVSVATGAAISTRTADAATAERAVVALVAQRRQAADAIAARREAELARLAALDAESARLSALLAARAATEKAAAEEIARDNGWAVEARDERLADAPGGVVVVTAVDARR